jgi:hypothetical protein
MTEMVKFESQLYGGVADVVNVWAEGAMFIESDSKECDSVVGGDRSAFISYRFADGFAFVVAEGDLGCLFDVDL